jgi:hypothetical protein
MKQLFYIIIFCVFTFNGFSQIHQSSFLQKSDSLARILYSDTDDQQKISANDELNVLFAEFLLQEAATTSTYDSLIFLKNLTTEDAAFCLLTWVVPLANEKFLYSGFIRKMKSGSVDTVFRLRSSEEGSEPNESYTPKSWPGAVYSEIIQHSVKDQDFYTLIGWQGKGEGLSGRIIETLWFDEEGKPVFGLPVIVTKSGELMCRHVFEFTDQVPFHLAYERQRLPGEKRKKDWMIVFNRLTGNQPGMGRFFRGAVPSYEIFDAFVFVGNRWVLFEDIDPRIESGSLPDERPGNLNLSPE